jgi:outer membrane protein
VTTSKIGVAVLAALCAASGARAQQPPPQPPQQPLTLAEATARALERNTDIRIDREDVSAAEARQTGALGNYDFRLKIDVSERHHRDPITTLFSGAPPGEVSPSNNDFSSSVSISRLFKSGATATGTATVARDATNSFFTLFVPAYITSLGVQVRQPLFKNRATDQARTELTITALDRQKSGAALQRQVLDVVAAVEKAYWALVAARREVAVRADSVTLAEKQRADTQTRIDARTAAALDIAEPTAEVERRRTDYFAAQESAARAERTLKLLMTDDPADPIWGQTLDPTDTVDVTPTRVNVQQALADAVSRRPELQAAAADVSASEAQTALAKDALRPQVDIVASYTSRGLAGDKNGNVFAFGGVPTVFPDVLSGGLGTSYQTLFETRFQDASIGISVDVPLGRRAARGDLGAAEAQGRQASLRLAQARDRIAVDVLNATTALETAAARIQSTRAGLAAATTQLQAEQDRFDAGASTNFLVLTRQTDLALARLAEITALADYRKAQTDFARATGTLLMERGITVRR